MMKGLVGRTNMRTELPMSMERRRPILSGKYEAGKKETTWPTV